MGQFLLSNANFIDDFLGFCWLRAHRSDDESGFLSKGLRRQDAVTILGRFLLVAVMIELEYTREQRVDC